MDIPDQAKDESAAAGSRRAKVAAAVKVWVAQLVDLGGRNTLLYYKDLRQGTLDLGTAAVGPREQLIAGRAVRLSVLFPGEEPQHDAARRARTVRAKATENFEERGLRTLYVALGMATWTNEIGTATPAAPVVLCPADLSPRGGAAEDFDIALPGEFEINPTLLHLLSSEYKITVDPDELLDLLPDDSSSTVDLEPVYDRLGKLAKDVPGFSISPRVVLGNFSYAKLPMVRDLEASEDELLESDLISAIAGDVEARDAVRSRHAEVTEDQPDHTPVADEFLVLDADASQNYAINAVLAGADLVIEGPPGTGKSQTIANLIATLTARGKRVLFVAEKRAAIDAVIDRLAKVGLSDLVMDLHDGVGNKRRFAQDLATALTRAGRTPLPNMGSQQRGLEQRRSTLVEHVSALHQQRDPWNLTVFEVQSRLLAIPDRVRSARRLQTDELNAFDTGARESALEQCRRLSELGGLALSPDQSPWAGALGRITSAERAGEALATTNRLLSDSLPKARARLRNLIAELSLRSPATVHEWADLLALLDRVQETLALYTPDVYDLASDAIEALAPALRNPVGRLGARLFNSRYRRMRKKVNSLRHGGRAKTRELLQEVNRASTELGSWRGFATDGGRPRIPAELEANEGAYQQLGLELRALGAFLGSDFEDLPTDSVQERLGALIKDQVTLFKLPEMFQLRTSLDAVGLGDLLGELSSRSMSPEDAVSCVEFVILSSILDAICIVDPRIGAFDGSYHSRVVQEFKQMDVQHIESTPERVRRAWAERLTQARDRFQAEADKINKEAAKSRKHMPVRDLFAASPNVLGAIKPCWALSPLVVSQILPARRCFDVVVFDEASQITPADAVGALLRADRAVVAGDTKQLPPTSFFIAAMGSDDGEADALLEDDLALTTNLESVLEVMGALLPPPYGTRTLGWHYRSHDERLIAFSNAQPDLYDWSLTTFPGVTIDGCLSHVLVPFRMGTVGQEESAGDEVNRVVDLILEHARARPEESLGVIAMGIKHADRISEALRRVRADHPDLDGFFDDSAKEPFFVKNLERVQGDERDAIILSIGYGKTPEGRMLYRFGPLNINGGERRLNVAITRARIRMTVVSSFSSSDMDPSRLRAEGAKMLQRYLTYAESGGADLGHVSREKVPLNPFERDVLDQLTAAGIPLVSQFGSSGYWIDFAAKHPRNAGRMVLAIESDGAGYHSSATARDRDRLRQEHLERLGWSFHRIWSTDWFRSREQEVAKTVQAYRAAVERADNPKTSNASFAPATGEAAPLHPSGPLRQGRPRIGRRGSIDEYSQNDLVAMVNWIESDTLLRTNDQLLEEMMRELGFRRRGSKIEARILAAIKQTRPRRK